MTKRTSAVIGKPSMDAIANQALDFASQKPLGAIKTGSARGKAGQASASPRKGAKAAVSESGGRVFYAPDGDKRLTINIAKDLHKKLKLMAIEQETNVGDLIEGWVKQNVK